MERKKIKVSFACIPKNRLLRAEEGQAMQSLLKVKSKSELIFRITLPKDDEEAMPPLEDEAHYNPVTEQELSVLKSWIKLGASFDAIINDLDEAGKKAAEHVLNNLPEKKLSATALLIPKLPEVSPADTSAIEKLRDSGLLVMPIAQNTNALYVNASYQGKSFNDESIELLQPIAPQLLWLNVARTAITDKATESLSNFSLLERLHAENTSADRWCHTKYIQTHKPKVFEPLRHRYF